MFFNIQLLYWEAYVLLLQYQEKISISRSREWARGLRVQNPAAQHFSSGFLRAPVLKLIFPWPRWGVTQCYFQAILTGMILIWIYSQS